MVNSLLAGHVCIGAWCNSVCTDSNADEHHCGSLCFKLSNYGIGSGKTAMQSLDSQEQCKWQWLQHVLQRLGHVLFLVRLCECTCGSREICRGLNLS